MIKKKNIGYQSFIKISKILNSEETSIDGPSENITINDMVYYKCATINSVDVERSFSVFKVLLADNRLILLTILLKINLYNFFI